MNRLRNYLALNNYTFVKLALYFLTYFIVFRIFFALLFLESSPDVHLHKDFFKALYLGLKFDLRVAIIMSLPFWFFHRMPFLSSPKTPPPLPWTYLYSTVLIFTTLFFIFDLGYYQYLNSRINATVFQFLENLDISMEMVWQTYPIFKIVMATIILSGINFYFLKKYVFNFQELQFQYSSEISTNKKRQVIGLISLIAITLLGLYGKADYYPLRWSESFFSGNRFYSAVATNPLHYFVDTIDNRKQDFDKEKVKKYYDLTHRFLGVDNPDFETLNFTRNQKPISPVNFPEKPNIVVIIMESLSAHRSGHFGNKCNATPYLDNFAEKGWSFKKHYTPSEGTARGVFATITGVADINKGRTSSRNPLIVDQNTAINAFTGYEKYYFIGGSASWGNIRGILKNNIYDLKLYEEEMFNSPRTDVWGISDYHLLKETFEVLTQRQNRKLPFFTIIQTASFHRPYTIPADRGDFETVNLDQKTLDNCGFESLEELNSMRFSDYSLGVFIELMKKTPEFDNTVFVILGDHGLPDNKAENLSPTEIQFSLERFHTPLVLYSPKHLKPQTFTKPISQQDILPTLAALTGHNFINKGMGRNFFDPQFDEMRYIFSYVYYTHPHKIFLLGDTFMVTGTPEDINAMYEYMSPLVPTNIKDDNTELFEEMKALLQALYETSKYVLHHNKKNQVKK